MKLFTKFVSILKKHRLEVSQIIDIENINVSKMKKEKKIIY